MPFRILEPWETGEGTAPGNQTTSTISFQRDPRVIGILKDGKEVTVDVASFSPEDFRAYLARVLDSKDWTDASCEQILAALKAFGPAKKVAPEQQGGKTKRRRGGCVKGGSKK